MLQTLKNAWSTKEIRSKILFTLFILLIYRVGAVIPVPFVDSNGAFAESLDGTILEYMNILSGGSMGNLTLFALGVQPYINASIILQLLAVVFPKLGELGKTDKKKMNLITRLVTVGLAIVTAVGYYFLLRNGGGHHETFLTHRAYEGNMAWFYGIVIVVCYTAGASLVMWLAERINEKGIGNGVSMILFANIVVAVPSFVINLSTLVVDTFNYPGDNVWVYPLVTTVFAVLLVAFLLALIAFVIFVTGSERRIPVQYAKKVVGRKMYGGQSTNLPIKLNMTGVMPIIFASSIVSFIPTVLQIVDSSLEKGLPEGWKTFSEVIGPNGAVYPILLFVLIIGFAYFYTQITFDPIEVANNLKKNGGAIPGIRQGRPTADHIRKILNKITLAGAIFLSFIAILPTILGPHAFQYLFEWIVKGGIPADQILSMGSTQYLYMNGMLQDLGTYVTTIASSYTGIFTFGGTTLLIVVGVAIETFRELEAQLTMRNYKGFLN